MCSGINLLRMGSHGGNEVSVPIECVELLEYIRVTVSFSRGLHLGITTSFVPLWSYCVCVRTHTLFSYYYLQQWWSKLGACAMHDTPWP